MSTPPHPFSLRQLQYIVAVADELSFHRAAARCHISQPTLSAQVAHAEEALGVRLFERTQRRVLVTATGRDLIERARRVILETNEMVHAAQRIGDPLSGTVRLGIIPTISPYLLPSTSPALRHQMPRLRIAWVEEKTDVLVAKLRDGELEGAVVALEAQLGEVEREVVANDPFLVVMPSSHPLAKKRGPVTQAQLRDEELLLLDEGHCFADQAIEACKTARVRHGEFRATSLTTLVQMVAGGAGITLVPALAVSAEAKRARLLARPLLGRGAHRTIAVIWRKRSSLSPTLRAIAAVLRQAYPQARRVRR